MKCFYHDDADGRAAAAVVLRYTGNTNKEDFFEVNYSTDLPDIETVNDGEVVYIVDYSFKENTKDFLEALILKGCDIIWIDHHMSSFEFEDANPEYKSIKGIRMNGICGAALTYMYLYKVEFGDIPQFLKYISDYDCWLFNYQETQSFSIGLHAKPYQVFDEVWQLLFDNENFANQLIQNGAVIKEHIDCESAEYLKKYGYETTLLGYPCLVVNRKTNSWIFGERISNYPFVVCYVHTGSLYTYTLYAGDGSVAVNKIAEQFGGGGHKGAAGFSSDHIVFDK